MKALFFDFDGTIVSPKTHEIPAVVVERMKQLKEKGYLLFLNTGRSKSILDSRIYDLPFDGYILSCGCYISFKDDVIYQSVVDKDLSKKLINWLNEFDIEGFFEGEQCLYYSNNLTHERMLYHLNDYKKNGVDIRPISNYTDSFEKLFIHFKNINTKVKFVDCISAYFDFIDRGNHCAELVPLDHSKGTAIDKIVELYHLDLNDCYAFGDSANDIEMFKKVVSSALIGNGETQGLEKYVSFLASDVDHLGLIEALDYFEL